jgi:hypothetical protein
MGNTEIQSVSTEAIARVECVPRCLGSFAAPSTTPQGTQWPSPSTCSSGHHRLLHLSTPQLSVSTGDSQAVTVAVDRAREGDGGGRRAHPLLQRSQRLGREHELAAVAELVADERHPEGERAQAVERAAWVRAAT